MYYTVVMYIRSYVHIRCNSYVYNNGNVCYTAVR